MSQTMEAQAMKQEITGLRMKHHELVQQQRTQTAEVALLNRQMALVEQQRESQQAEIEQLRAQARVSYHSKKIQPWYIWLFSVASTQPYCYHLFPHYN